MRRKWRAISRKIDVRLHADQSGGMAADTVLGERGRVTIPSDTSERMGWKPGMALRLIVTPEGDIVLQPYPAKRKPLRAI